MIIYDEASDINPETWSKFMNANQLGILLASDHVDVTVTTYLYHDPANRWRCTLNKSSEGVNLSIQHEAADLESALLGAYEKYSKVVNTGVPEFKGPLLEHQPTPPLTPYEEAMARSTLNSEDSYDEIPF